MKTDMIYSTLRKAAIGIMAAVGIGSFAVQTQAASKLSSGKWVKIRVETTGIHQITDAQLKEMGFADPSKVAVYGNPAVLMANYMLTADLTDDVVAIPSKNVDGKLLFYALGDMYLKPVRGYNPTYTYKNEHVSVLRNFYADYGTYFLTDSQPAAEVKQIAAPEAPAETDINSGYGLVCYEDEASNPDSFGPRYFSPGLTKGETGVYNFKMPQFREGNETDGYTKMPMLFLIASKNTSSAQQSIQLPGNASGSIYISKHSESYHHYYGQSSIFNANTSAAPVKVTDDDTYSVKINTTINGTLWLDYFTALYPQWNRMGDRNCAEFAYTNIQKTNTISFEADEAKDWIVWDITDPMEVKEMAYIRYAETPEPPENPENPENPEGTEGTEGTENAGTTEGEGTTEEPTEPQPKKLLLASPGTFTTSMGQQAFARLMVFDPSAEYEGVTPVGDVEAQDLHSMDVPNMLIVTIKDLMPEAEMLAGIHKKYTGVETAIVTLPEVYNEFTGGTPHIMAVRKLASMLYKRNPEKFRSILFMGPAHNDNRYLKSDDREAMHAQYLPMYMNESPNTFGSSPTGYQTDAFVAMLDYDKSDFTATSPNMTVSVGRIPIADRSKMQSYIRKVEHFLKNVKGNEMMNNAVISTDAGNENGHMIDGDKLANIILKESPTTTVVKAHNSIYPFVNNRAQTPNNILTANFKKGTGYYTFSGHSLSHYQIGGGEIWNVTMLENLDYDVPVFAMLSTCGVADPDKTSRSMTDAFLDKEKGGAIGVVASCRTVFMNKNQYMAEQVTGALFTKGKSKTYGDVFRNAFNGCHNIGLSSSQTSDVMLNTLCYGLYGDPEIPIPSENVYPTLTAVNGEAIAKDASVKVNANSKLALAGTVNNADGETDSSFNGFVRVNIYDAPKTMKVINAENDTYLGQETTLDESLISTKILEVKDGKFAGEVYVANPAREGKYNRVQLYAYNDTQWGRGGSYGLQIAISDEYPALTEATAPEILTYYINTEDFTDGDVINGDGARVYATVAANEFGLMGEYSTVGHDLQLVLDGVRTLSGAAGYFVVDPDGSGSLDFPLSGVAEGRHTLTLRVTNGAGQSTTRSLEFTLVNAAYHPTLAVEEYPATEQATITLDNSSTQTPAGHIVISSTTGEHVLTVENPAFPYVWNLKDAEGNRVENGRYEAEGFFRDGNKYGHAAKVEVIVHADK